MTSFDRLTRELTAFENQDALLSALGGYRPTIRPMATDRRYEVLADAYDVAQAERGDERRAYRGGVQHWFSPTAAVRLNGVKHGSGQVGDWLRVIWEINTIAKGTIGEPLACYWGHGGWTEEYPEFRVVLVGDENTSGEVADIVAFTDDAAALLCRAVRMLGLGDIPVCAQCADDVYHGTRLPHVCDAFYIRQDEPLAMLQRVVADAWSH